MDKAGIESIMLALFNSSGGNLIADRKAEHIFDAPIMGVACAADPIFESYKAEGVIGPWYMLPEDWLSGAKSVVSFFFPFSEAVRKSNYPGGFDIGYQWLYGRVEGQDFINSTMAQFAKALEKEGIRCVVPSGDVRFKSVAGGIGSLENELINAESFSSNWSERHAAYACGLGTFGLSKGLITEKGIAGRFASVIVDSELEATVRPYTEVYEYCSRCGACVRRCPVKAISLESGKNHTICDQWLTEAKRRYAPRYGCGLCQTKVPCEFERPKKA